MKPKPWKIMIVAGATISASAAGPYSEAFAQQTARPAASAEPSAPPSLRTFLEKLQYDADERGALLAVASDDAFELPSEESGANAGDSRLPLATLARLTGRKVVKIGGIRALVPLTMKLIESHPGKPNPYRGISKEDAIHFLMGTFTPDQWQTACSPDGIGLTDLREDQKKFFVGMLPGKVALFDKPTISGTPGAAEDISVSKPEDVRLRLNLLAHYSTPGDADIAGGSGFEAVGAPDHVGLLYRSDKWRATDGLDDHATAAFGVRIVRVVPNRQKLSQLDYSWSQLDRSISVGDLGRTSTVGDVIERVARETRLDVVCDRRASSMPIYVRGDSVRAGDLLQSIALAVTGTYRKIGATSAYVLTDDIEGMGTRATRIAAWAERADNERTKLLDAAAARAAKLNALSYLNFAPNDPLALPTKIKDSLLAEYRKGADQIDQVTKSSDLPVAYRTDIDQNYQKYMAAHGSATDISKVRLGMDVAMSFLIPGVGPVLDPLNRAEQEIRHLAQIPHVSEARQPSDDPIDWTWLSAPHKKRVLLIAPHTTAEATTLIAAARRHGFTEAWVKVDAGLTGTKGESASSARAFLTAAIAAGKRASIAVGADISLLQSNNDSDALERNIFGQTGAEFASSYIAPPPVDSSEAKADDADDDDSDDTAIDIFDKGAESVRERFANWRSADPAEITRRMTAIADIPGLAGIVLQQTAAPGFIHEDDSPVPLGGELGFSDARRLAFLHKEGCDPIDVGSERDDPALTGLDELDLALPFFKDDNKAAKYIVEGGKLKDNPAVESLQFQWDKFRATENNQLIGAIYRSFRELHPKIPLWIDDRTSDYANVFTWFGTLDDPAKLPKHSTNTDMDVEAAGLDAARTASKSVLRCARPPMTGLYASHADAYISVIGTRAVSEGWNGIVIDLTHMPAEAATSLLRKMPEITPNVRIASAPR